MRAACDNCGEPVDGRFCSLCGQSTGTIDRPAFAMARELASEALALDSRIRLTLWPLIVRPGQVARDYVEGHRARFVPPVRLYLLASFFMFVVLSFGEFEVSNVEVDGRQVTVDSISRIGDATVASSDTAAAPDSAATVDAIPGSGDSTFGGTLSGDTISVTGAAGGLRGGLRVDLGADEVNDQLAVGFQRLMEDPAAFNDVLIDRLAKAMFVLLPVFAGMLKLLWRGRLYIHHLIFSIYFHSFVFLVIGVGGIPEALGFEQLGEVLDLLVLTFPIYLVLALKTFYGSGWPRAIGSAVLLTMVYGTLVLVAILGLLFWSILAL